jgi:ABC-2 type transport system ATP-binding protein
MLEHSITAAAPAPELRLAPLAPKLELLGVTKHWGPKAVLDGVDLVVEPGQAAHIFGRNGSGKTTLLRIAVGLIRPDGGVIELDGLHPERDRRAYQRQVGFLSAGDRGLYARMTVRDHLRLWARLAFIPRGHTATVIGDALSRFGLGELVTRRVERLSMGQRQRVRLAGVFLHDPSVVMLDEPRNSLDGEGVELLASLLKEFRGRGGSVLWCSPSGEQAELDFDRRYELVDGRLSTR